MQFQTVATVPMAGVPVAGVSTVPGVPGAVAVQPYVPGPPGFKLTCHAKKVEAKDGMHIAALGSTSDPFLVIKSCATNAIAGKSGVDMKTVNPKWKPFEVDTYTCGGMNAWIMVQIYDWDKDGKHDFIGETRTTLQELTSKVGVPIELINMKKRGRAFYKNSGVLYVDAVEQLTTSTRHAKVLQFEFAAKNLDIKDVSMSSDPFFVIYGTPKIYNAFGMAIGKPFLKPYTRKAGSTKKSKYSGISGKQVVVYRSKPIMRNLNPKWEPFTLESRLCGGMNGHIRIEVWDWDKSGEHDFIGGADMTLSELLVEGAKFPLINKEKKDRALYYNSGILEIKSAKPAVGVTLVNELTIHGAKVTFAADNLSSRDLFSKSDPFITIKNSAGNLIYRSEEYMNKKNPVFKEVMLSTVNCGGLDGELLITVWDWDGSGKHDVIGELKTSLRDLSFHTTETRWRLVCHKYKGVVGYKNSGFLLCKNLEFVTGDPLANVLTPVTAVATMPGQTAAAMIPPMAMGGAAVAMGVQGMAMPMTPMMPGAMPGMMPGMMPGAMPGLMPGAMPGVRVGGMPMMGQQMVGVGVGGMPVMNQQPMGMGVGGMPIMAPGMMPQGNYFQYMQPMQQMPLAQPVIKM